MRETTRKLLLIDGIVNLLLGLLLLLFPIGMAPILGVPISESNFYPTILGAVLFGIGIALLIDAYGQPHGIHGLGIAGAIAINFCGAGVLIVWLLFTPLNLPLRGYIVLWMIAIIVTAIGSIELAIMSWKRRCSDKKRAINLNDCSRSG
ncbi:MAG: hypothetical protein PVI54_09960 [Desulfobacteraceae bacterium]|jgi:hypothetical protein